MRRGGPFLLLVAFWGFGAGHAALEEAHCLRLEGGGGDVLLEGTARSAFMQIWDRV